MVTLRDHADRVVARNTSPPIMITDDHKAAAALANSMGKGSSRKTSASDAESSKASSSAAMSRAPSLKKQDESNSGGKAPSSLRRASSDASDGENSRSTKRRAPYDVNQRGQPRPRPGHLSRSPSFAMTPLMTPLTVSKPGSPTQRFGNFPRTAPASLAPSPSRSDSLPLPPSDQQAESAPESGALDALSEALAVSQAAIRQGAVPAAPVGGRPNGVAPAGVQRRASDGDIEMRDESHGSSQENSPNVLDRSMLGASPAQSHSDSVDSFSSNTQSSATSLEIHNQANLGLPSSIFPQFPGPVADQLAAAAAVPVEPTPSGAISPQSQGSATSPGWGTETPRNNGSSAPRISRLIPAEGPMQGGIEITILGEGFYPGVTCVFGDTPAVPTHLWSSTTLVCTLPPSSSPGPCVVSFRGVPITVHAGSGVQVFTYIDNSDQKLMELALQVVGLQMTGTLQTESDGQAELTDSILQGASKMQRTLPCASSVKVGAPAAPVAARPAAVRAGTAARPTSASWQPRLRRPRARS